MRLSWSRTGQTSYSFWETGVGLRLGTDTRLGECKQTTIKATLGNTSEAELGTEASALGAVTGRGTEGRSSGARCGATGQNPGQRRLAQACPI